MSQRPQVKEWTTYDHLCFSAKVQYLVDEATCCNLEIFINRLAEMGSALSACSRARLYILQKLIGRVLEADAETLDHVIDKLKTWIEDLGPLPALESCYRREMLNIAFDTIDHYQKEE